MSGVGRWDRPDFSDPRFAVEHVSEAQRCRHDGCDRLAELLIDYSMRRDGWTYEYRCGYCQEHVPPQVLEAQSAA